MIDRRKFSTLLTAAALTSAVPNAPRAESRPTAKNVVLVHGLFADGSC